MRVISKTGFVLPGNVPISTIAQGIQRRLFQPGQMVAGCELIENGHEPRVGISQRAVEIENYQLEPLAGFVFIHGVHFT